MPKRTEGKRLTKAQRERENDYGDLFKVASVVLANEPGHLYWAADDYVAFRYIEEFSTVRIVFYPHRTSASNYHLRVRDEGSKDKRRAELLMKRLDIGAGHSCTFTRKNAPRIYTDTEGKEYGWGVKEALGPIGRSWI